MHTPYRRPAGACLALAVGLLAGCAADQPATAPDLTPAFALATLPVIYDYSPAVGEVKVCKFQTTSSGFVSANFTASASGAGTLQATDFTVPIDGCSVIWTADPGQASNTAVTVTELVPTGWVLNRIAVLEAPSGTTTFLYSPAGNQTTVNVNADVGYALWFKNEESSTPPPPPPPPGGEGCTPGYWKQSQHFDSWPAPYTPGTQFSTVFADAFPGQTLLDVAALRGGGLNALGRHAVAALLSSASVHYGLTTAQVIAAFNAAYASGDYEPQKDIFDALNNAGCPLN